MIPSTRWKNLIGNEQEVKGTTMTTVYTYDMLKQMKGQAVKDIWHAYLGKPAGLKNTTGLRNSEEIIQAILKVQTDPDFLAKLSQRTPKQKEESEVEQEVEMPPKKKQNTLVIPKPTQPVVKKSGILAIESSDIPIVASEVKKIMLRKLHVDDQSYFIDINSKELYAIVDTKPGPLVGKWDAETRSILSI